jgi:hypothetical protein
MTHDEAASLADEFLRLVVARTGLRGSDLVCPREKSAMTPCLARDGHLVVVLDHAGNPLCVGCEARLLDLLDRERQKATT